MIDRDDKRRAWAGVFIRGNRLTVARDHYLRQRRVFEALLSRSISPGDLTDIDRLREPGRAAERLTYFGEVILMFADAATNALATAVRFTYGDRDATPSLRDLVRWLEGDEEAHDPDLAPLVERMRRIYYSVNVPRHALAVHPPANASANGFEWTGEGALFMSGWSGSWDPEEEDWRELQEAVSTELDKDFGGVRDSLIGRVLYDLIDLPLSRTTLERLTNYIRTHGCSVSPERVCEVTLALLADIASQFGHDRSDFFSDLA